MTISFHNIESVLDTETQKLKKDECDKAGICCLVDSYTVSYNAQKILIDNEVPRESKKTLFSATVTINPLNKELCNIITKYFLNVKISGLMDMPERLFFDKVIINDEFVINK